MTRTVAFQVFPLGAPDAWWPACPPCGEAEVGSARLLPLDAPQCSVERGTGSCRACGAELPRRRVTSGPGETGDVLIEVVGHRARGAVGST